MNESEMGYRVSKSWDHSWVKEQRVDGGCFPVKYKTSKLRYTLMARESGYQLEVLSNLFTKSHFSTTSYSNLSPEFVTGFTDA